MSASTKGAESPDRGHQTTAPALSWCGNLTEFEDFREAGELYRQVFDYYDPDLSINANLMVALIRNGGSAVGARGPDGSLVGFAYGFPAADAAGPYHYSQATVVHPAYQGAGVGRILKFQQRAVAVEHGQNRMRWAFDPLLARNAHFNLDVLGGRAVSFVEDFYRRPHTDRLVVEWDLSALPSDQAGLNRAKRAALPDRVRQAAFGIAIHDGADTWIRLPASVPPAPHEASATPPPLADTRLVLRESLRNLYETGAMVVSSCRVDADSSVYLAQPIPAQ